MLLTSCLDLIAEKLKKLSYPKIFIMLSLLFMLVIFINGISHVPPRHYQRLSQNPFITRVDIADDNYWQETVLLPVLAYYTRLNSLSSFNFLCFAILALALILFAHLTFQQFGPAEALIFTTILLTSPLLTVILSWMGTPDSLTFALTVPFLFVTSGPLIFFLSVLGTLNHVAFVVAAGEILLLRWLSHPRIKFHHLIAAVLGGAAGYSLVKLFLMLNHIEILVSRADFILSRDLKTWTEINLHNFPISIFSLFNIQWLIIIASVIMFFKMDKMFYSCLLAILLLNYGLTFFTEDTTRIFSVLSWGILMECIFHSYKLALKNDDKNGAFQKQFLFALIIIGLTSFITPRYYSWQGNIFTTPFHEFFKRFIDI